MSPCYTRHEVAPGIHADIPHEHDEEPPPCEAEERNRRALYEISRQRTEDAISIHRIERLLRGETCEH